MTSIFSAAVLALQVLSPTSPDPSAVGEENPEWWSLEEDGTVWVQVWTMPEMPQGWHVLDGQGVPRGADRAPSREPGCSTARGCGRDS